MDKNVRIAKELVRIAKSLVAGEEEDAEKKILNALLRTFPLVILGHCNTHQDGTVTWEDTKIEYELDSYDGTKVSFKFMHLGNDENDNISSLKKVYLSYGIKATNNISKEVEYHLDGVRFYLHPNLNFLSPGDDIIYTDKAWHLKDKKTADKFVKALSETCDQEDEKKEFTLLIKRVMANIKDEHQKNNKK